MLSNSTGQFLTGDSIPVTANGGVQNAFFTVAGVTPTVTLNQGAVLTAGFLTSASSLVQLNTAASGLIDYVHNGNDLPTALPGPFGAASTYSLDRTVKFNIGFQSSRFGTNTTTTLMSSGNPMTNGTSVSSQPQ